jgi:hypothetical protein
MRASETGVLPIDDAAIELIAGFRADVLSGVDAGRRQIARVRAGDPSFPLDNDSADDTLGYIRHDIDRGLDEITACDSILARVT